MIYRVSKTSSKIRFYVKSKILTRNTQGWSTKWNDKRLHHSATVYMFHIKNLKDSSKTKYDENKQIQKIINLPESSQNVENKASLNGLPPPWGISN